MTSPQDIKILKTIVHKVDHHKYDEAILSDLESPLENDVEGFLKVHIVANREHSRARKAWFVSLPNQISQLCDGIVISSGQFINSSQELAKLLFSEMHGKKTIDPGDLVICSYQENGSDEPQLAILKMDPMDGFIGEREDVQGKTRIVLKRVPDILPISELQKCAFILPPNLRKKKGYDLIILDQQAARYGVRRPVASFFQTGFLQCKTGLDQKEQTRNFIYQSQAWIDGKKEELSSEDIRRFKQRTTDYVNSNMVDVTAFAQELLSTPELQDGYLSFIEEKIEGLTFVPDQQERQKWTGYAWYRGDNDLEIRIRSNAIGSTLKTMFDDKTNTFIITIRTTNWEKYLKRG